MNKKIVSVTLLDLAANECKKYDANPPVRRAFSGSEKWSKSTSKYHKNEDRRLEAYRLRAEGPNMLSSLKMERRLRAFKLFTAGFCYQSLDL